jgi:uncharacterized BrkB/YihY/UPF0761 family membrane protein
MTEEDPPAAKPDNGDDGGDLDARSWRHYETAIRDRLDAATSAAEERRKRSHFYDSAFLVWERNRVLPASVLVGALASRIVIYIVPLFALIIFSFGLYGTYTGESASSAMRGAGMAGLFAQAADDSAGVEDGWRFVVVIATLYAALYAANSLGRLVRRCNALVWGVPYTKPARSWRVPLLVVVVSLVGWSLASLGAAPGDWTFEAVIGALTLEVIILTFVWTLIGRILPHHPEATRWGDFVPGALFVSLGIVGLRVAMVVYFSREVEALTERYGSIALGLVMLTWAYWLGMIVVGSAEINAALFQSRRAKTKAKTG